MKTPFRYLLSLFLLFVMTACSGQDKQYEAATSDMPAAGSAVESRVAAESPVAPSPEVAAEDVSAGSTQPAAIPQVAQQIIREGQAVFETSDLKKTKTWIESLVRSHKAYVSNDEQNKGSDRIEQRMTLRIPADRFDAFLGDLEKGVVRFDSKSITATDVTEEFIDISQRLKVKKATEERYIALLAKAASVHDVLETEKYISEVRSEIESLEGRLKYLKNRIGLSTLTVTFYQLKPEMQGFASRFGVAFSEGWNNFLSFLLGAISLWPFLIAGAAIIGVVRLLLKLRK
ncbi:conserved hypothetical protein [Chlorobium limicola DSM 245]|uniref:DUF4349 domain-containing protein n=1 Tax=Chlorobium limicola (strain DSM 245 / NBRC 103803 / 6330) TaxID=290315 RepID=B3EGC6_CHLL2|nr:DUF4349 domain-containing protein [Chlorobium limicola]ACD91135.1 conserved hypothetical protein [Chlorobium limicola DSM 245]